MNMEELVSRLSKMDGEELAKELIALDKNILPSICRELGGCLSDAVLLLPPNMQAEILGFLHEEELSEVVEDWSVEETVDVLEEIPLPIARKIAEKEEIERLVEERNFALLKPLVCGMNAIDLAIIFNDLEERYLPIVFRFLPKDLGADVFVELDRDQKERLLHSISDSELKAVLDELFLDDTVDLIEEMPANVVKRLLAQTNKEVRNVVNEILKYPKDSAGSVMTVEFVSLRAEMKVKQAFEKIRKTAIDKETIYTAYVTDDKNHLLGVVAVKELLLADPQSLVGEIMEKNVIYSLTSDDREVVARKISDYGFLAIPIVDNETRLVGIVTVDDAMDVLQEETSEDISKMAAISPSENPYLKRSVWEIVKSRMPWLMILMISATFTGLILNVFEGRLNAISPVLFACIPMLMDTGGNSGSQASVTIIRALAIGELTLKDVGKVLWKEFRASLLLGLTLAVMCFAKLQLIDRFLFGFDYTLLRSGVVSLSLLFTVVLAKVVGSSLPLLAKKCRLDPAVVASPFITTIVDALSLSLYCVVAILVL